MPVEQEDEDAAEVVSSLALRICAPTPRALLYPLRAQAKHRLVILMGFCNLRVTNFALQDDVYKEHRFQKRESALPDPSGNPPRSPG